MKTKRARQPVRYWWADQSHRGVISSHVLAIIEELEFRQRELKKARAVRGCCYICGGQISPRRLRLVEGAVLCTTCALLARRTRSLLEPLSRRN